MRDADVYYGERASRYEERRSGDTVWQLEQKAVQSMLRHGPVLDAPIGTGRYIPVYESKGLVWTGLDISDHMIKEAKRRAPHGRYICDDIRTTTFYRQYGTVVCSRLLNWLSPEDMTLVIQRLAEVATDLIVSVRTSLDPEPRPDGNQTHSHDDWMRATDGLHIDCTRRLHARVPGALFEMHRLTRPTMDSVRSLFRHHGDGPDAIQRLCDDWTRMLGIQRVDATTGSVSAVRWSGPQIGEIVREMAQHSPAMVTSARPRRSTGPVVIARSQGEMWMIDGRRRANLWMKLDHLRPVLIVDLDPC